MANCYFTPLVNDFYDHFFISHCEDLRFSYDCDLSLKSIWIEMVRQPVPIISGGISGQKYTWPDATSDQDGNGDAGTKKGSNN